MALFVSIALATLGTFPTPLMTSLAAMNPVWAGVYAQIYRYRHHASRIQRQQTKWIVSTLGIAALFTPLRTRVQSFIDRRFYRKKYGAEQALAEFASAARDEVDMERLTEALLGVVAGTVQPERVSLWSLDDR